MSTAIIVIFVLVLISFAGCFWFFDRFFEKRDKSKIRDRLLERTGGKEAAPGEQPLFRAEEGERKSLMARVLALLRLDTRLTEFIEQAGLRWSSGRTALALLILGIGGFDAAWYLLPYFKMSAVPVGLFCGSLPLIYIWRRRSSRMARFEAQFPEALEFIARAMRAGHAFSVSLEMLHQEFTDPLGGEFRRTFDEQNLGLPIELALQKLGTRVALIDVQFFVSSVVLQKRTGGNLAEILDKLAGLIRERFKLRAQIRTISAQGRMSGLVLTMIPIVVGTIMFYVNPEHMRFFAEDPAGTYMAGLALGFQVLGFLIIRKIVNIEV